MNDFNTDLNMSRDPEVAELFDAAYVQVFPGLEFIDTVSDLETQKRGIDKVLRFELGRTLTVEEKARRKDYGDICLEGWSVWSPTKRVPGWLFTSQADWLAYGVLSSRNVYLFPMPTLRAAWHANREEWWKLYPQHIAKNPGYETRFIAIPVPVLLSAVATQLEGERHNVAV